MDLQTRKLNVIQYLIGLKDESIFSVFEKIVNESKSKETKTYRTFSKQEMIDRAKKSNLDYLAGNFKDQEQLETESKDW